MNRAPVIIAVILSGLLWAGPQAGYAQNGPDRALVSAASANAINSLRNEVLAARITPTMTVSQFVEKTQSIGELDQSLQRCQQIGGPRVIDEQTVQVRMEISGTRVATTLVNIAAAFPHLSPINAGELDQRLTDMKQRTFSGTGTSVSAQRLDVIRPIGVSDRWTAVSDEERVRTLAAAREDAARSVIGNIRPIELTPGRTVGELLADPAAEQRVSQWLVAQPVTKLRYKDDLEIELAISAPPQQVMDTVLQGSPVRPDEERIEQLRTEFAQRLTGASGRAKVGANPAPANSATVALPLQPPQWISQPLDVEAIAPRANSPLLTKNAAERRAADSLRAKVGALRLDQTTTLDDAARQDPRLADAINRMLLRARVYRVEYLADGGVRVRMMIDPRDLWQELQIAGQ